MFMAYEGLKDSGTFMVDSTTKGKLAGDPKKLIGKVVAFTVADAQTGDPQVGYGTADAAIAGVVTACEQAETASEEFVATVSWNNTFDGIATSSSTKTAKEGVGLAVDGAGGVNTSATMTNAFCMALNKGKTSCVIRVL